MAISRRSVLAAGVGVPLAAATTAAGGGNALAPFTGSGAHSGAAPQDPSEFHLTRRLRTRRGSGAPYADTVDALAGELETVPVQAVTADADGLRTGARIGTSAGRGIADGWVCGFGWEGHGAGNGGSSGGSGGHNSGDRSDSSVRGWRPQGITTDHDAYGVRPRTLLVSWYDRGGAVDKGMRISVVAWPGNGDGGGSGNGDGGAEPTYRHALLAEPYRDAEGRATFAPIRRHAGGIAWYGDLLYVVDTWGGLRVFDLRRLLRVRKGGRNRVGFPQETGGVLSAYDYTYVVPQIAAYDNAGRDFRYTAVSVDRTTVPHSLLVCEYSDDTADRPRVMRLPAVRSRDALPRRLTAGEVHTVTTTRRDDGEVIGRRRIQGAVSVRGTYYLSVSAGGHRDGKLCAWVPDAERPARLGGLSRGPEDLSYDATANVLWTVGEYHEDRYVYAVTPTRRG